MWFLTVNNDHNGPKQNFAVRPYMLKQYLGPDLIIWTTLGFDPKRWILRLADLKRYA